MTPPTDTADSAATRISALGFLAGGGEMGALMRSRDWSATPLGPPERWPQSLRTVVRIVLSSRYAMWMAWGPDLTFFCNDAYRPTLGVKGADWALGAPASKVWAEIWADIGPRIDSVLRTGVATYDEDLLLFLERSGFTEETYHTFSYSPLADDDGAIVGMLCVVTEVTEQIIDERRLGFLRDLSAELAGSHRRDLTFQALSRLALHHKDLPFTLAYLFDADGSGRAHLVGRTGFLGNHEAAPLVIEPEEAHPAWPAREILSRRHKLVVDDLDAIFATPVPSGAWPEPPGIAAVMPIAQQGAEHPAGFIVAGINPFRLYDAAYAGFLDLAVVQIAASLANVRAYEEERRRAEALAEIDSAKTAFFSNVSHEFRTPLTLMLGPLDEALEEGVGLPLHARTRLEVAQRNGRRLLKLVNSLLDFSRIEAGRAKASFAAVDLAALTAELASNFRSACERAGLRLVVDCPPLPQPAFVDADMWEKIVLNLLSNAFKFTFAGRIDVTLRARDGRAEMAIADSGTGIPAAEVGRVFERFHRIEGARGRSFEGSGIGLALVLELVRLHGGTIGVESKEGVGTTFTVALPLGRAHLPSDRVREQPAAVAAPVHAHDYVEEAMRWLAEPGDDVAVPETLPGQAPATAETGQRSRLLVVDDNVDMRDYVRRLLGARHDIEVVGDGEAALAAIAAQRPDLVVTDLMMPRLDGFGLLRAIRSDAVLRDIPVIVLSARAGEDARLEGLGGGADDYLAKPFSARELVARVEAALSMAKMRREAAAALRESEARFRHMADQAPVMIWTSDAAGNPIYRSRSYHEFIGDGVGGNADDWFGTIHPDDHHAMEGAMHAAILQVEGFRVEFRIRRRDGVYRWHLATAVARFGAEGEFLGHIGSMIDISERKEAEEAQKRINDLLAEKVAEAMAERDAIEAQLMQAQKMEAVGKLTGGLAHDFNNLLQVIGGNLQLIAKDVVGNERAQKRLTSALNGVSRGSKLASQLLAFGRRQPLEPRVVHLGKLLHGLDDLLRRAIGEEIELETVVAGGLWNTLVDPSQVENALLNLAINARDAMGGEGKLTVEASNASIDDEYAARHAEVTPGQYVVLAVSDTGSGIPADLLEEVFEPFFTTKPEGQGTGLGLSMVYGFVKQSGGHVKIYSEVDHGTTVRLYLPRSRKPEDIMVVADAGPATGGHETILAVEDDEGVRLTVVEMLNDLGYRVLTAKDAQSALIVIESGAPIDLLFTDVVMPGPVRSPELARQALQRLPGIKVLFTSGYTDNAIVHDGRLDEGANLLSKPYTREAMARKIRSVLGERTPAAPEPRPPNARPGGRPRVLVVEDDGLIRLSTTDMLESLGNEVIDVGNAAEAMKVLTSQPIDMLLTDIGLPGVSGKDLALRARQALPDLPVIFATGNAETVDIGGDSPFARAVILAKPYGERELVKAINAALGHLSLERAEQ